MNWRRTGSIVMFLAVAAGAFGAHALKNSLSEPMKAVYETAVRYQMIHGVVLLFISTIPLERVTRWTIRAAWCFAAGIVLFSGSLYILALTGVRLWGAVTPFGGLALLAGWLMLCL